MADNVCEKLDELALDFFDKFEQLQTKRDEICKIMKDGYLNLSQARYSMGNKAVCSLQYSEKMKASTLVELNEDGEMAFEIVNFKPENCTKNDDEETSSSLRKRNVKNHESKNAVGGLSTKMKDSIDDDVGELSLQDLSLSLKDDQKRTDDPLKWFGVLVPMCLRTGQAQFRTAIDLCCELVNLENEIGVLIEKYKIQKKLKMHGAKRLTNKLENIE